jgi:hypothetical protein
MALDAARRAGESAQLAEVSTQAEDLKPRESAFTKNIFDVGN